MTTAVAVASSATTPASPNSSGRHDLSWLGLAAPAGGIGFTILYIVLGSLRAGYSPVRQLISALGTGSDGAWLDVGFVLAGLLIVAGMVGFGCGLRLGPGRRAASTVLLAAPALGLIVCGFFPMDTNLAVHTAGAQLACALPIVTFPIVAELLWRSSRPIATWLLISATLALLALLGWMFLSTTDYTDFTTIAGGGTVGLWERAIAINLFTVGYPSLGIIGVVLARRTNCGG
jgi:4-amino-4-deoxy-L-arabinose transferase-like glycosyltransferase